MREKLVTLKNFSTSTEALIVKARLEAYGIPCMLVDEHIVGVNPIFDHALSGVKLRVLEKDFEQAKSLLGEELS